MATKKTNEKQTLELYDRMADALETIAEGGGGGGGGGGGSALPAVTAEDNGDVLTVVEGAWAKAAPASGGNAMIIDYNAVTFPSYNDILAAIAGGKIVMAVDTAEPDAAICFYFTVAIFDESDNSYKAFFFSPPDETFTLVATTKTDPMTV